MKKTSTGILAAAIAMVFTLTGCGIFEPDDESSTELFHVKDTKSGKSIAGNSGNLNPGNVPPADPNLNPNVAPNPNAGLNSNGPGAFGGNDVLGVDPSNPYADFGSVIPGLQFQPVYFHFDQSNIETGEKSKLDAVASYLMTNAGTGVVIEGHCDLKGTDEYNRGLGERRALSAKDYLLAKGIQENRIRTISYGKEKPAVPGETEDACSKNRRDEFVGVKLKQ